MGCLRTLDELLYYVLYRKFLQAKEVSQVLGAVDSTERHPQKPLAEIKQVRPKSIKSSELQHLIESSELDAIFAVCIDVYLPEKIINAPKHGAFLWHEGITPEYRGVYSPFWALVKKDYDNLGYTLLKMNSKLDAGEVFVQGKVENVDLKTHWHSYIGHKAIIDSLPRVREFLVQLESNQHQPTNRENTIDGYYSYPTASALLKIVVDRLFGEQIRSTSSHPSERSEHLQRPDSSIGPS